MSSKSIKKRVLVVDDDPVLLRMLEARLGEEGYDVQLVNEAAKGLQFAINNPPDLIILDVMMPVINGYNFCKILKSEIADLYIPVIFLTSRAHEDDVKIGYEMGADEYLTKPVDMPLLLTRMNALIERNT